MELANGLTLATIEIPQIAELDPSYERKKKFCLQLFGVMAILIL